MNPWVCRMALGILALFVMATEARSETLSEALIAAYVNNPTLLGERASLRSTDEQVPRALSGWRPTVTLTGEAGASRVDSQSGFFGASQNRNLRAIRGTLTQPLYRGGRTVATTSRAENLVMADRAKLIDTEQAVLREVVSAYMNVLRDREVLNLAINNEERLRRQLQAARDRFEVGEVTRTDVAQAEARVSNAVAERVTTESNLVASRAAYLNVTGSLPANLSQPPPLNNLPESELQSREIATKESPEILRALYIERAARDDIAVQFGVLLPTLDLNGELRRTEDGSSRDSLSNSASITARLTVPLYQSGSEHSDVRAAREVASQRRIEIEQTRRSVLENVTQSWENLLTARARITAFRDAVRAAEIALDGVEQEAAVGSRTTLDVLDAEQELFDVRVDLVSAERDNVVASYFLQAAIGRLSVANLGLNVPIYDETRHYNEVRDKAWGYGEVD